MSQNSTTSLNSLSFRPINSDDGDGESNSQPTQTTRLDKQVASVSRLQKNATVLKSLSIKSVDDVLESINNIVYRGKLKDIATLKSLKCTLESVSKDIMDDAATLSPIPSMRYVQQRRSVSPDMIDTSNNKRRVQPNRLKTPPPKRLKHKDVTIEYSAPTNGNVYSPTEVVEILALNPNNKSRIINQMISNDDIPIKRAGVYKMLQRVDSGA